MITLDKSRLLSGLGEAEIQELRRIAQVRSYPKGTAIFAAGDPGDGLFVIGEGGVTISALINQTEQRALSKLEAGDFFGEMAVLDNEPRSATVTADPDCTVYFIPREDLLNRLGQSPQLALSLVRQFSLRMRDFNRQYVKEVVQAERFAIIGRFARSIVHDFKNPLAIIGFATDMTATEGATPEICVLAHERIRKQVDRLSNMINELLEFTRGSQVANVLALTNYASFVTPLIEELRSETAAKSVTLVYANEPPDLSLLLDPRRLTHAFFNLIHNAVDEMPNGGTITLRFMVMKKEVVTEIEDQGKGITPEVAAKLFEPFATFGKAHGTGLGLSICKRIIEDHHGWIKARNAPQQGAIFAFAIPRPA
jgi:signal transduction histidine kinase